MKDNDIIARVEKLLRLAQSNNESEAAAALLKAQELAHQHNLNMDEISRRTEGTQGPEMQEAVIDHRLMTWMMELLMAIADINGCHVLQDGGRIIVIGADTDAYLVRSLWLHIQEQVEKLTKKALAGNPRKTGRRKWATSYRFGLCHRLAERLYKQRDELQATKGAIVVQRAAAAREYMLETYHIRHTNRSYRPDAHGFLSGASDANAIRLSRDIEG